MSESRAVHPVGELRSLLERSIALRRKSVSVTPICFNVARIVGQVPSPTPIGGCWRDSIRVIANALLAPPGITRREHAGGDPTGRATADNQISTVRLAERHLRSFLNASRPAEQNRFLRATKADTCDTEAI